MQLVQLESYDDEQLELELEVAERTASGFLLLLCLRHASLRLDVYQSPHWP